MTAAPPAHPDIAHRPIHPEVAIGHVALKVADVARALAFYRDALGFAVTGRLGDQAVFLAAGGYHHHLALVTVDSQGGPPPAPGTGTTGLHHLAIRYPSRRELARAVERLLDHGATIDRASDHGVNEAVYLADPDGNGIELYADRAGGRWPRDERGELIPAHPPLDLDDLLAEIDIGRDGRRQPATAVDAGGSS